MTSSTAAPSPERHLEQLPATVPPSAPTPWRAPLATAPWFVAKGLLGWIAAFALVAALSWQHRDAPYYWDSLGYVWPHANELHQAFPSPFLRAYDVGHPTLFYWLWAASWKVAAWQGMADPQAPIVGHLLTWAFAALAFCATYGLGRALDQPRGIAFGGAASSLALPVVWANAQLVQLDLPMHALAMAAIFFWVRRRPLLYFCAATGAILTKLYGFAPLCGVGATVFLGSGRWWRKGNRASFAKLVAWTYAPLLALPLFLLARYNALGELKWSIAYPQPTEKTIYLWDGARFLAHLPFAYEIYFRATLTHYLLIALILAAPVALVATLLRRSEEPIRVLFEPTARYNALMALAIMGVGYTLAIFQFGTGLVLPRYVMPVAAAIILLLFQSLWAIGRRRAWVIGAQTALVLGCWVFWHPSHSAFLPGPLKEWLRRSPAPAGHSLEVDLRFLDATSLGAWAAERIAVDAKVAGRSCAATTAWPVTVAFHVPAMGWVDGVLPNATFSDWNAIDPATHPYVVSMRPVTGFPDPPEELGAVMVAKEKRGDVEAIVWRLEPRAETVVASEELVEEAAEPSGQSGEAEEDVGPVSPAQPAVEPTAADEPEPEPTESPAAAPTTYLTTKVVKVSPEESESPAAPAPVCAPTP